MDTKLCMHNAYQICLAHSAADRAHGIKEKLFYQQNFQSLYNMGKGKGCPSADWCRWILQM